ncbi:MAG TPA: P-loop NTPase, partial [Acidimicrobiia bacterium]|nr:P-loop NTPase [Acidimicrobiia bacterium]
METEAGIVLVTTSPDWETRVRKAFDGRLNGELSQRPEACTPGEPQTALDVVLAGGPRVVVLGPDCDVDHSLAVAREIDDRHHETCTVLVADPTPELWEKALRAGVRDIVAPDAALVDVRNVIERAVETAAKRRAVASTDAAQREAKILAVVSPKGGAGKTAIATNLAVGLAHEHPGDVVLVDLDLQFGDVANALRLDPETTITDVSRAVGAIDATTLKAYLTPHSSGLFVLCAPETPGVADDIAIEHVGTAIELLSQVFRYVVVDTAAGLDDVALTAMERASDLVVVCGTDVASARGARKELEAFNMLGLTTQRRIFVLNRADARVGLNVRDIESTVGMSVDFSIPSSRAVPLSMNQGTPLLDMDARTPVSKAFSDLVST